VSFTATRRAVDPDPERALYLEELFLESDDPAAGAQVTSKLLVLPSLLSVCEMANTAEEGDIRLSPLEELPDPTTPNSSKSSFANPTGFIPFKRALSFLRLEFLEIGFQPPLVTLPFLEWALLMLLFRDTPPFDERLTWRFKSLTLFFDANSRGTFDRSSASQTSEKAPVPSGSTSRSEGPDVGDAGAATRVGQALVGAMMSPS
jgi:hypothetical protein